MNERILELMTKAGFDVEKLRMYPGGWPREDLLVLQDFAELIVQECIRLCDQVDVVGADECIDNIREHFGVRE